MSLISLYRTFFVFGYQMSKILLCFNSVFNHLSIDTGLIF